MRFYKSYGLCETLFNGYTSKSLQYFVKMFEIEYNFAKIMPQKINYCHGTRPSECIFGQSLFPSIQSTQGKTIRGKPSSPAEESHTCPPHPPAHPPGTHGAETQYRAEIRGLWEKKRHSACRLIQVKHLWRDQLFSPRTSPTHPPTKIKQD